MAAIPLLYGYIQQLQQHQPSISSDLNWLVLDTKSYFSALPSANFLLIILTALLVLCCFGWVFESLTSNINQQPNSQGFDPEEFDYLSSREAIPAKFNLAEAYIKMGDNDSATQVLTEIINQGDNNQRNRAMSLLDAIE